MDNLTHSLVGALIGQAGLKRKTGLAMPALIIGANLPDVDAACFFWLDGVEHLGFRRGITHGPPALVLLPLILAGLLWGCDRWQTKRGAGWFSRPEGRLPVHFGWLFALSFIGCLTHPAMDWMNVYGIRLLEPFSSQWFYGDVLFIIDVWLWLGMGLATWWSLRREKKGGDWRKVARVGIAASLAYIGMNYVISHYLYQTAVLHARPIEVIQSPVPFAFWERETIIGFDQPDLPPWIVGTSHSASHAIGCVVPDDTDIVNRPDVAAFLFWSRAPFAERAPDGSVILRDARFYDPRARDRFSVFLPDVECVELEPQ